jgi:hypothetical protein
MGITRRANRERPLSTQAGRSAGPSERLKPDPQRPLVCIAMTTAGHAPQETSSETQSFLSVQDGRRDVCPEFRLLLGRIVVGCDASGLAVVAWKSMMTPGRGSFAQLASAMNS